jgi:tetrahydromethanopterin S-methyltransferase subunit G
MAEVVERVANLEGRFDAQAQQLDDIKESLVRLEDKMDRRFDAVDRRFTAVESRVTALEGSTNARFTSIDNRFDGFERRMENGFTELRDEMRSNFRWIIGAVAGAALTVITTVLGAMFVWRAGP